MPVLSKKTRSKYESELRDRFESLIEALNGRELKSAQEGAGNSAWGDPSAMCATIGTAMEIRLAAEDFKGILGEIKKFK